MNKVRILSTAQPEKQLTYQEWVDELRIHEKVIVSSKYHSKSIEERVMIDEANEFKREHEESLIKTSGTVEPRILFGKLKTILSIF